MNRFVRGLLSGASFAALNMGFFAATRTARAAGFDVHGSVPFFNFAGGNLDYIWVHGDADITGDLTNHGTVGPPGAATPSGAIEINGKVGNVLNASDGTINATNWAIDVRTSGGLGSVTGAIENDGHINLMHTTTGPAGVFRVTQNAHLGGGIINHGSIQVHVTGHDAGSYLQALQVNVADHIANTLSTNFHNAAFAVFNVSAKTTKTSVLIGASTQLGKHGAVLFQSVVNGSTTGIAGASIGNAGDISIGVHAQVHASFNGAATAQLGVAVSQKAHGYYAADYLANSGSLKIDATAFVNQSGPNPNPLIGVANASIDDGIVQRVLGSNSLTGNASAVLQNTGTAGHHALIEIKAHAFAAASGTYSGSTVAHATAHAEIQAGIFQRVSTAADIKVALTNNQGTIKVLATATADYAGSGSQRAALADAHIRSAIVQSARSAAVAHLDIENHGNIKIGIKASAVASVQGNATALAWDKYQVSSIPRGLIHQVATRSLAQVIAKLDNFGAINISETATAHANFNGNTGKAVASAGGGSGITNVNAPRRSIDDEFGMAGFSQLAVVTQGSQAARLTITNSGSFAVKAKALAFGGHDADAYGHIATGIRQSVGTSGHFAHAVTAKLSNQSNHTMDITARAFAGVNTIFNSLTTNHLSGVSALADATLHRGILQKVHGTNAHLTLDNVGALTIRATALALGQTHASAVADVGERNSSQRGFALSQYVDGEGAHEKIENSGSLAILANALARATAAGTGRANAHAQIEGIRQFATNYTKAQQTFTNGDFLVIKANADARVIGVVGQTLNATAVVHTGLLQSATSGSTSAHLRAANQASATMSIAATAVAYGGRADAALAIISQAIRQRIEDGVGAMLVQNDGILRVAALANETASHGGQAHALASGIGQTGHGGGSYMSATVANGATGVIEVTANAFAQGHSGAVRATAVGGAVHQSVTGVAAAREALINSGDISLRFEASALGTGQASAQAGYHSGHTAAVVLQSARVTSSHVATLTVQNHAGGILLGKAVASAHGDKAVAIAAMRGVQQKASLVDSGLANLKVHNAGHLTVSATANAVGPHGGSIGEIDAFATGVLQTAKRTSGNDTQVANATVTNSGQIKVNAHAIGSGLFGTAGARAAAVDEAFYEIDANVHFDNAIGGVIAVDAVGHAPAALVHAAGLSIHGSGSSYTVNTVQHPTAGGTQVFHSGSAHLPVVFDLDIHNNGTLKVTASAVGAAANAAATGIGVFAQSKTAESHVTTFHVGGGSNGLSTVRRGGAPLTGNIENDGTLKVTAKAAGQAIAHGILIAGGDVEVGVLNKGHLTVLASGLTATAAGIQIHNPTIVFTSHFGSHGTGAAAANSGFKSSPILHATIENDGTIKVTAKAAGAIAQGISLDASPFTGAIINKGTIAVEADGAGGQAVAIQLLDSSNTTNGGSGSLINNGGTISAKLVNGGVTSWGTAIDVSNAPNIMNIGLSGNGNIYGNVKLKSNSAVTVSGSGITFFSGVINPSKTKAGTVTIAAGGNLELANDATQGNAKLYVTTFNQIGTLSVDVGSTGNATPYINAGAVTLSGALVVVPGTALPVNGTTFKIVGSTAALATSWSGVSIKGAPALLTATASYLSNEADVTIGIAAPSSLGLTANQLAILDPFEKQLANILTLSSIDPNSSLGKLVTALFTLTAPQLAGVLDQLSDLDAGAQAQSNLSFASSLLSQILDHLGAGTLGGGGVASLQAYPAGVRPAQMTSGAGTVWGGIYGAHASTRAVAGSPGSSTSVTGFMAGYDVALNTDLLAGLVGSYSTDTGKTGSPGGHSSANGFQVSPYFQLTRDSGFFSRGSLSYGNYNNKVSRTVTVPGFGTGTLGGKFNSDVYSAYLEAGQKFVTDDGTAVSPYAALGYARSASGAYTETGFAGPALTVNSAVAQTLTSYLGVGFEKNFALGDSSLLPHIRIAWAHDYSGSAWQVGAQFAALPGSGFVINGPGLSRDKAYINAGVSLHLSDDVETSLNYDALFNDDQSQQSLMGVLRFSF